MQLRAGASEGVVPRAGSGGTLARIEAVGSGEGERKGGRVGGETDLTWPRLAAKTAKAEEEDEIRGGDVGGGSPLG